MRYILSALLVLVLSLDAHAALHKEAVEYNHEDTVLEGYLVYDDGTKSKRPGILIVHQWKGLGHYEIGRAEQLAETGFVAFAVDMYGKGIRPKNNEEAAKQAAIYRRDRQLMRARAMAGLDVLQKQEMVDPVRIAAIGYCFGGGTVLEMARGGADIAGVVSFHGNLDTPDPSHARDAKAKILVLHGADDPHVPMDQVMTFQEEMRNAGIDWQLVIYGGAVHSFTNPAAGSDVSTGAAYNKAADKRSWKAMKAFFREIFKKEDSQ